VDHTSQAEEKEVMLSYQMEQDPQQQNLDEGLEVHKRHLNI